MKILCKCGCGIEREKFDKRGRERFFINGHQSIFYGKLKKGTTPWNKGRKNIYSKETLKKMSEKKIGIKLEEEHKKKIGLGNIKNSFKENYKRKQARWKAKEQNKKTNCEICKSPKKLERHHWDYNKPLLVATLCKECHTIQHLKNFQTSKYATQEVLI
jgi:hypothetical protein